MNGRTRRGALACGRRGAPDARWAAPSSPEQRRFGWVRSLRQSAFSPCFPTLVFVVTWLSASRCYFYQLLWCSKPRLFAATMEELEEEVTCQVNSFKAFLENFNDSHSFENADEDFLQGTTLVTEEDFEAEVLDWALQYLLGSKCPSALAAALARNVLLEIKTVNLKEICHKNTGVSDSLGYQPIDLWRIVVSKVHDICQQWQDAPEVDLRDLTSRKETVSLCAIKNSRRTMEDRHVVIQDLNILFGLQGHPQTSFFAVFDGHAGTGAACYSAVHLHYNIIHHPSYPHDIKTAMKEGFTKTDKNFIVKSNREGLKSGSTAVCCLLRDKEMYLAWLGDSQAILVRDGAAIEMMKPHKPDREDERERIEKLGGCVVHFGTWRVNGTLAVSRAIGDAEYKPYVSSDPDVDVMHLDGTEDFIILACDGLWDVLQPNDVVKQVYSYLAQSNGDADSVAAKLVQVAKEEGSGDNITVLAVFMRDVGELISDLVIPESPMRDVSFSSHFPAAPTNGNPFGDAVQLESGKTASFESFGSEFVQVESRTTCVTSTVQTSDDGAFPTASPPFPQFLPGWDAANFSQQVEGGVAGGFAADLPANRNNFPPFENPFDQYERPALNYERPAQPELDNQFYAAADAGSFFEYQAKTEVENLVEFENNVADWPDNAASVELESNDYDLEKQHDGGALNKGLFDPIKPFQSNLSPDAEPFIMGNRVHAGDEFVQNVSHVPSQPLEAFLDAKPYTPYSHGETEVLRSPEEFASSTPDLLASTDAFVPVDEPLGTSTEIPTAPPAESGLFDETGVANVLPNTEQFEIEHGRNEAYLEDKFERDSQRAAPLEENHHHVPSAEVIESEDNLASLSPEPESVDSERDMLDWVLLEEQQRRSVEELFPEADVQEQESQQSPETGTGVVERDILESVPSDDQQKPSVEDFEFRGYNPVAFAEAQQPLLSPEEENIGFEINVLQNIPSEGLRSPLTEDFVPRDDLMNVTAQSPSEQKIVEAEFDIHRSLPPEDYARLPQATSHPEDTEKIDDQDWKFGASQLEQENFTSEDEEIRVVEVSFPEVNELVNVEDEKPDLSYAGHEIVDLTITREKVALEPDVAIEREHQREVVDVTFGLDDQQVPSLTAEALTNVETMVSEVKFDYLESSTGLVSETLLSDIDLQPDIKPKRDLDAKEDEAPLAEPAADAIPDAVPIADDVEDDESEDGEEWKFYRSNGVESKAAESVEARPVSDAEVPILNGHADAEILSLEVATAEAADVSNFAEADTETEQNTSFDELNIRRAKTPDMSEMTSKAEVLPTAEPPEPEHVTVAPAEEPAKAPIEPTKPKVPTTKTASKTVGNKGAATVQSRTTASKPNKTNGRLAPKAAAQKPAAAAAAAAPKPSASAPKPLAAAQKPSTTASKPSTTAPKAAAAPLKKPTPLADTTKKAPAARPKQSTPTAKVEGAARVAPVRPPSDLASKKPASASVAAKVSKEQSNVRSKAPAAANGATKETTVPAKKPQSAAATVASRQATKPSSAPVKDAAKKDVAKAAITVRAASARVDVKQTKETVNKQISGVSRRVITTTTTTTKTSAVKVDANGTKGPAATSSPKTPVATAGNKEAAEKKPSSGVRVTPKARTPVAKSLPNSSPNNAGATRSPVPSKAKTPAKTPVAAVRERGTTSKSPLKASTPGKPIRKTPPGAVTTITGNSPSKGKVEEASNEKGILDATSKENPPAENGVGHPLQNGNGHGVEGEEHSEQQQADADLVLV